MKIRKKFNKQKKRDFWHARFVLNNKSFMPKAETKEKLLDLIVEIRSQEKIERDNEKYNLSREVPAFFPNVQTVFDETLPMIQKRKQKVLAERVFEDFLYLLPPQIKVNEIKVFHFQSYINFRKGQLGKQTGKPPKLTTIYKELYAVTGALKEAAARYESLENWQAPKLPALPKGYKKKTKRERLVTERELETVIAELLKPPKGRQLHTRFHRVRLAHQIEFQYETGLRRKEFAALKFSQYDDAQQALLNVRRWKTGTITKFFPLSKRAVELSEERRKLQACDFIFTPDGKPIEANYRTLREVCKDLDISYGRFTDGGFVAHDLRHNFATEISQVTDIETAKSLTGHTGNEIFTYLHTNQQRQREAVRKREKRDYTSELDKLFEAVQKKKITKEKFAEIVKKLFGF
ncbi:MAG: tyrosine-type recombinase/integrase [Pyrinomonadaceae bacterium]